jgi:3'(2'), 5'-bisphosphate nucleotidase
LTDVELACELAHEAGQMLLTLQKRGGDGKALGAEGDKISNAHLTAKLREQRPGDSLLSEEEMDDVARLACQRVWIIDPLDGTREFGEGRSDWAVHVALAVNGVATTGAVVLPALGEVYSTNARSSPFEPSLRPRVVVSRSRPAKEALAVAKAIDAELIPMGSAGAKAMAVVRGDADIYLHTGGQFEWDSCAPVAVASAYGLHTSRVDGSPLRYNCADLYMPDLLICRAEWASKVLALMGS